MKAPARLIIPLWGEAYASKLATMTLPALLAPDNLPALADMFDVELVLVTETKLFDKIREAGSFQQLARLCRTRFVSLDDLMTDLPGDYGVVLTYALFRGFGDLGERMTDTYLLFLNADFIISDGSLRHLGKLMLEGKRVIHAPSFRVVLEDVWPKLQAAVDPEKGALAMSARDMVKLALTHKHVTVKARTVNQRLCHQLWMDQFYWYVDEDTLIGYQLPVALVAIKPERAVTEPVLVWDYGFIPEAAPTAARHFIGDSDDFFMLEPQKRLTGQNMVRLGWISTDDIARNLSSWKTREQRDCGKQLLVIHAGPLPAGLEGVVEESRGYMAEVYDRLDPTPKSHIGHSWLGHWFDEAKYRMRGTPEGTSAVALPPRATHDPADEPSRYYRLATAALQAGYATLFGRLPDIRRHHPLWIDTYALTAKLAQWETGGKSRVLWLSSGDSLFHRKLRDRHDPMSLLIETEPRPPDIKDSYDACLCELNPEDLPSLRRLYERVRPLIREGGEIVVYVFNRSGAQIKADDLTFCETALPDRDRSAMYFFGSWSTALLRRSYLHVSTSLQGRPLSRGIMTAGVLLALAPFARLANSIAGRRDASMFGGTWTSLMMVFTVQRRLPDARPAEPASCGLKLPQGTPSIRCAHTGSR
jgi:hypothetical protein